MTSHITLAVVCACCLVSVAGQDRESSSFQRQHPVPGQPGLDYPTYSHVPRTNFTCHGKQTGGYYPDMETRCQVFHLCSPDQNGDLFNFAFICPNGTIFNQGFFLCDWWFNTDCQQS